MLATSQPPKRRRQSIARAAAASSGNRPVAPARRVSSRFDDEDRRLSICVEPVPTPHRRRLLSDVMTTTTSQFKPAKSAVMCVGNVPTTTPQFYYTAPVDRYDLSSCGPRNSIDVISPKRRSRRVYKEGGLHPHTCQDLVSTCGSGLWKLSENRSRGGQRSARVGSTREHKSNSEQIISDSFRHSLSLSHPVREKRSHTVQLQRVPAFTQFPLMEGSSVEYRRTSMREEGIMRPTPRRRMSQASHHTARHSERALSPSTSSNSSPSSSSSSMNHREVVRVHEGGDESGESDSSIDFTHSAARITTREGDGEVTTSSSSSNSDVRVSSRAGFNEVQDGSDVDDGDDDVLGSGSNWITFMDSACGTGTWQSKIVLRFASNFWWNEYSGSSSVEKTLNQAFINTWTDPNRREHMIQESCRAMELATANCGKGLLEVERTLHCLLTHPPAAGSLPSHITCGGGEAMPISRPKLESGGPSFFTCIRKPPTNATSKSGSNRSTSSSRIPYISDCYDRLTTDQDLHQAWYYLVRSGTSALISQLASHKISDPVILSLCTRHFVKYAYICLTHEDSMRQGVTVYPLSRKLRWDSAADREDISTLSYCVWAWLRCA